jgi:non-ribosomal peptide synthetase-like protein
VTATLAKQLPEPSVPTKIFLVEKFVMKPVSGKIDRECLPKLSDLLRNAEPDAEYAPASMQGIREEEIKPPDAAMDSACEEVLAICRAVFETPLELDHGFVEAGGHSILIARLAQQLQASGWRVPVRALLSDCNTARKVASCPRAPQMPKTAMVALESGKNTAELDQTAAAVLSIEYFTTLQILFAMLLYSPSIVAFLIALNSLEVGTFFTTANLGQFIIFGSFLYLLGLVTPFAFLLWVMMIKSFIENVSPGVYPKWSKMHLRIWCIGRLEHIVLLTLRIMYRSAPLLAFVLRRLGARVGDNLQCAHDAFLSGPLDLIRIDDDVAIQTGAYIQTTRWSGQYLQVGRVQLESGCKIGVRAAIANDVTVGRGSWITPFTPILSDVGSQEMWEGAPARLSGRCTKLMRMAKTCQYASPIWLQETANVLMQIFISFWLVVVPTAAILWFVRSLIPAGDASLSDEYFQATPLFDIVWHLTVYALITGWMTIVVTSVLGCLFIRYTAASPGLYPSRGLSAALLMYRMHMMNLIQRNWTWTVTGQYLRGLAGMRFARVGASECDLMFNLVPELASAGSYVFWSNSCFTNMLDCDSGYFTLRQLDMPHNFFGGNNCVAEYGQFPSNFLLGVSTPGNGIQFRRQLRSRLGDPVTVAGNPPVRIASASFDAETKIHRRPEFPIFLTRVLLFDLFGIGILPITEGLIFTILYLCLLRWGGYLVASAVIALLLTEVSLVLLCVGIKKSLVGSKWGADGSAPFWSWRHFAYFFAQDCFFVWCRGSLSFCAGTILSNSILRWMGCQIGRRTILAQPMQCSDWNAVCFGDDCVVDGVLQFHTFENMILKVKRTCVQDGCAVSFGATVMGGAVIERDTTLLPLSLVLKEMHLPTATYEGSPVEPVSVTS